MNDPVLGRSRFMRLVMLTVLSGVLIGSVASCGRRKADDGDRLMPLEVSQSAASITSAQQVVNTAGGDAKTPRNAGPVAYTKDMNGAPRPRERKMMIGESTAQPPVQGGDAVVAPLPVARDALTGGPRRAQPLALKVPLIALGISPSLKLTAHQVHQAIDLGQAFFAATADDPTVAASQATVQAGGGAESAAAAKAAFEFRWRSAQQKSDEQFRALFGYAAFNAQQILRSQQEYQNQQAGR